MCRSMVMGRIRRKAQNASTWTIHMRLVPAVERAQLGAVDEGGQRVADEAPPLEVGRPLGGDAEHLGREAGDADQQEHAEDDGVLGLGLDADAVRALDVRGGRWPRAMPARNTSPAASPTKE